MYTHYTYIYIYIYICICVCVCFYSPTITHDHAPVSDKTTKR